MKLITQSVRAPFSVRGDDLYETPPEAVRVLLAVESLPKCIWEPACGPGSIVRVLRGSGHLVLATDLVVYQSADQDEGGRDFLLERQLPAGVEAIVTNPPFKLAQAFVQHALELCPRVIMLLRLAFLESERRRPILDCGQLARVHVFRNRLPIDAPRLGRSQGQLGNGVRVASLESRPQRPDRAPPHLVDRTFARVRTS